MIFFFAEFLNLFVVEFRKEVLLGFVKAFLTKRQTDEVIFLPDIGRVFRKAEIQ